MQEFIVLKDKDGLYLPSAFITRNDEAGQVRAKKYFDNNNIEDSGDSLVVVEFEETGLYAN